MNHSLHSGYKKRKVRHCNKKHKFKSLNAQPLQRLKIPLNSSVPNISKATGNVTRRHNFE